VADPKQVEGPTDHEIFARLIPAHRRVLTVGNEVFVPPVFTRRRPYQFPVRAIRFLYHFGTTQDFAKACELAECSKNFVKKFLKSDDWKAFAAEAITDEAIADGWNPRRVVLELDAIFRGERVVNVTQLEALKEMRQILMPKTRENAGTGPSGVTVNLNFPVLPADVQARLKALADEAATIEVDAA
jgi:hypothetical protein